MLSPHPSHILIAFPPSQRWGFVTDNTGATMMRIPVSTGGISLPNNTAYDIIFSAVNSDTNSKLVVAETFTRVDLMDGCINIYLGTNLKPGIYTVRATLNDAFPGLSPVEALLNDRSELDVECCPKNEDSNIRRGRATVDVPPPGAGGVQVAADSHLGSRRLRGKARDTSNSTAGGSEDLWQRNDSAWAAAVIQFYNEANYNMHRLNLLGWDLHAYDADAGAPHKASTLLSTLLLLYSCATLFLCFTHALRMLIHALLNRLQSQALKTSTGLTSKRSYSISRTKQSDASPRTAWSY
jgi:hypothetical protein